MKVSCVHIDRFRYQSELLRQPELRGRPVLIVKVEGSRRTVVDFSPGLRGVQTGMPLERALAYAKDATVIESDDLYHQSMFAKVLGTLERRSPVVEEGDLGLAYVGLDGLEELYKGEERLMAALQNAIPAAMIARIGVGPNKFVAYLASLAVAPGGVFKAPDDLGRFLSGFPVDVLPVDYDTRAKLHGFGLHTLGDLARLDIGPLQAQFGKPGAFIWHLAHGVDARPLVPRKVEEDVSESLGFPTPAASLHEVLLAVDALLGRLFLRPEVRGRLARLSILEGQLYRGGTWVKRISFKDPVGDKRRAFFRIKSCFDASPLPGPLEQLTIALKGLTGEAGHQAGLLPEARQEEELREAVRQMEVTMGQHPPLYTIKEIEPWSRIPERRYALVPFAP